MSTVGTDPAQPQPDIQPDPAAAAAAAAAQPAAPAADAPPVVTDPDELELLEAREAAKTEEAATPATPAAEPAAGAAPAANANQPTDQQQPAVPARPARSPMVPKARFDEALGERDKLREEKAYLQGQLDALGHKPAASGQPGAQQPPAQQTPDQRIAAVHTEIDALAVKFDAGEMSMAEFKRQERELEAKVHTIREEVLTSKIKPAGEGSGDLYLSQATAQLEGAHPWTHVFEAVGTEADWAFLKARAIENLTDANVSLKGSVGKLSLREEMAKLADEYGPSMVGKKATAKGIALPGQTPQTPQPQDATAAAAAAVKARQDKLALRNAAPPNVAAMSGGGGAADALSDARVEAMTDDEYDALPASTRNRLKGISP